MLARLYVSNSASINVDTRVQCTHAQHENVFYTDSINSTPQPPPHPNNNGVQNIGALEQLQSQLISLGFGGPEVLALEAPDQDEPESASSFVRAQEAEDLTVELPSSSNGGGGGGGGAAAGAGIAVPQCDVCFQIDPDETENAEVVCRACKKAKKNYFHFCSGCYDKVHLKRKGKDHKGVPIAEFREAARELYDTCNLHGLPQFDHDVEPETCHGVENPPKSKTSAPLAKDYGLTKQNIGRTMHMWDTLSCWKVFVIRLEKGGVLAPLVADYILELLEGLLTASQKHGSHYKMWRSTILEMPKMLALLDKEALCYGNYM